MESRILPTVKDGARNTVKMFERGFRMAFKNCIGEQG